MTHRDALLLPLQIFAYGEDNGIPGEVPSEYDLRGCDFIFFGERYDYWVIAEEYPVHFEESVRFEYIIVYQKFWLIGRSICY